MLINEQGEIDKEYDFYFDRIQSCHTKEEVEIEFGLHWARMNLIHKKYREHEKEIANKGVDLGRGLSV